MGRPVVLSNGQLVVGLNEKGFVHDFYFPYVGQENLTTSRKIHHRIGVYVDNQFSWLDDENWHTELGIDSTSLTTSIVMRSDKFGLRLHFSDFVDTEKNVFCRLLNIQNLRNEKRDVKVFFHQVFEISNHGRSDTAMFVPDGPYLLDYKGRLCLLAYARNNEGKDFDQYTCGSYGIEGKEGSFKDAEDGELTNNAVEHGGVDSVLRVSQQLEAAAEAEIEYWVLAHSSQFHLEREHEFMKREGAQARLEHTKDWWKNWLAPAMLRIDKLPLSDDERSAVVRSLMIIKAHCDQRGGIVASCDSSIYNYNRDYYSYVWPRDGCFVIWPLIRLGLYKEARKFFNFCSDIQTEDGYLMHKYLSDRSIGSTWHPLMRGQRHELAIQEDETAIVVFMLGEYLDYSKDEEFTNEMFQKFVVPAANFMARFIDLDTGLPHASYDLWEEKFLTHTYTVALTYRALLVAVSLAKRFGEDQNSDEWENAARKMQQNSKILFNEDSKSYRKGILLDASGDITFDNTIDVSSMYGPMMFEFGLNKALTAQTAHAVESKLKDSCPEGGVPRYEHDNYFATQPQYEGNPWFVTSLWLAQYYIRTGRLEDARQLIDWALEHRSSTETLPEQIGASGGARVGVEPLVWSHAELVNTLLDYYG